MQESIISVGCVQCCMLVWLKAGKDRFWRNWCWVWHKWHVVVRNSASYCVHCQWYTYTIKFCITRGAHVWCLLCNVSYLLFSVQYMQTELYSVYLSVLLCLSSTVKNRISYHQALHYAANHYSGFSWDNFAGSAYLLMIRVSTVEINGYFSSYHQNDVGHHRLRGSASPVLTATHHSYGSVFTQWCAFCSKSRYFSYPLISRPPKRSKFGKFLDLEIFRSIWPLTLQVTERTPLILHRIPMKVA